MSDVLRFVDAGVLRSGAPILHNINWDVADGERWVILGPNGAGKSTLLSLAAALEHPTSGSVEVLDERLGGSDVFELRPRIGLVGPALTARIPHSERALDTVRTAAYAVTGRWRERYEGSDDIRAEQLLVDLGVGHLVDRTFATLSEGERKRVAIARALMPDPELLLLDEPAAGLDLGAREELVARLGRLASDPTAAVMVLVTHHVEEIPPGVDHALLLRDGAVVAAGRIETTLTAEALSAAFGLPLELERHAGRWAARLSVSGAGAT